MFHGECIVTLEDVAILTGLPVTGEATYMECDKEMDRALLVEEVLGETPERGFVKADERLKISWLRDRFYSCSDIEDGDPQVLEYVRAYMLGIISIIVEFLLAYRSSVDMHCEYIMLLTKQQPFGWGVVVLSWLYRELGWVSFKIESTPSSISTNDIVCMDGVGTCLVSREILCRCTEDARACG
ncbi:Protein MAIN-LIKE 2 [Linum grandiflorum]